MSYEEIRNYLWLLLHQHDVVPQQVQIDPSVIDPDRIRSVEHSKLAGLQVADAVASGIHFGVKVNRYGEAEPGYLSHLKKMLYHHKGQGGTCRLWHQSMARGLCDHKSKSPRGRKPRRLVGSA